MEKLMNMGMQESRMMRLSKFPGIFVQSESDNTYHLSKNHRNIKKLVDITEFLFK